MDKEQINTILELINQIENEEEYLNEEGLNLANNPIYLEFKDLIDEYFQSEWI